MPKISKSERNSPWYKYGTDKGYQKFCRTLPCAYSGITTNIVYAHYRTAQNSGTGFKPPFSGIPLTWEEHADQHQHGTYTFMPREKWEYLCQLYLEKWRNSLINGA